MKTWGEDPMRTEGWGGAPTMPRRARGPGQPGAGVEGLSPGAGVEGLSPGGFRGAGQADTNV